MKCLTSICIVLFCMGIARAQPVKTKGESSSDWFNNFQKFSGGSRANVDSAVYYVQKLASDKRYFLDLTDLLHNSFAQHFVKSDQEDMKDLARLEQLTNHRILGLKILDKMMQDPTQALRESIHPLFLWTRIQRDSANPAALKKLTEEFIKTEIEGNDLYKNRSGRYGLMISNIIANHPELASLNEKLLRMITADLKANQIKLEDVSTRARKDQRAWYRYLYAYVNFIASKKADKVEAKGQYLKTAFEFSPDLMDRGNKSAYFYDMFLIDGGGNSSFQDEYLDFIMYSKDRTYVLSTLSSIALVDPDYKDMLRTYYNSGSPIKSFATYWSEIINNGAPDAPAISLAAIDKQLFSTKEHAGKWILVDFWGTWCMPCRAEHPDLQKFYDSTVVRNADRIALMTIACNDQVEEVTAYMKEKRFSFPVAMSDQQIEKTYVVQGYPTKILITPVGKYVTIPFNIDWRDFIKKYSDLE